MKKQKTMGYWPLKDISINSIYLDTKNIRLPISETSQDAILQDLFSNEDAFEIVKSIKQYGLFPDEFPIVIKEKGKLVVIEGNRRLAALKALDNPDRVPLYKERIRSLKSPKIADVRVVLAPNRNAASSLIANKHTANLRRAWKPLRQAYFYKSQFDNGKKIEDLEKEYPGHDIRKFMKMLEAHHLAKTIVYNSDDVTLIVHDERKFPITNLERMYEDVYVLKYLGLEFDNKGKATITSKTDEFKQAYKRIIEDIALEILNSRNTNTKEQKKEYVDKLAQEVRPTKGKTSSSSSLKENKVDKQALSKKVKSKRKEKGLIPAHVPCTIDNSSIKILYNELRKIPVDDFANASHDLLRSFLECSLVFYLKETGEYKLIQNHPKHTPKLGELLTFVQSDKCNSITDQNIKQVVEHIKKEYDQPYSLARLNMVNHNEDWVSSPKEVRAAWSKLERLMKLILNPPQVNNSKASRRK